MVRITNFLKYPIKLRGGGTLIEDTMRIYVRGGSGGKGVAKMGGVGGDGGDVYLKADTRATLRAMLHPTKPKRFIADNGRNATRLFVLGERGKDLTVKVPVGISVCTDDDKELTALNKPGEQILIAKGGEGGCARNSFVGEEPLPHMIRLYLKLIADMGFVGFPNAGKSTLLKAISRAKPKISSYPFTTLRPQVGIMHFDDGRQISVADLPGLIEGAYKNVGFGHKFLKHVERTLLLVIVVDINGFKLNDESPYRTAFETLILLNKELELYNEDLLDKPAVLVINKMDAQGAQRKLDNLLEQIANVDERLANFDAEMRPTKLLQFKDVFQICALEPQSDAVQNMKRRLRELLDDVDELKRLRIEKEDNLNPTVRIPTVRRSLV